MQDNRGIKVSGGDFLRALRKVGAAAGVISSLLVAQQRAARNSQLVG